MLSPFKVECLDSIMRLVKLQKETSYLSIADFIELVSYFSLVEPDDLKEYHKLTGIDLHHIRSTMNYASRVIYNSHREINYKNHYRELKE